MQPVQSLIQTTRPAHREEINRMATWVLWMYERGQPVALWKDTGRISLVPKSLKTREIVFLRKMEAGPESSPP
ncbi:MAG: hypothetical protein PHQ40_16570 [Anaerolineaceae bacterium]|nr:hypothetical protein [Anaerolineaceae bacterium]